MLSLPNLALVIQSSFLHSAAPRARDGLSVSLMQDFAEKALVPKLDSYNLVLRILSGGLSLDLAFCQVLHGYFCVAEVVLIWVASRVN